MPNALLTVQETAQLRGCTDRYVRKLIANGRLEYREVDSPGNNMREYRIPLKALPAELQYKYMRAQAQELAPAAPESAVIRAIDEYTEEERERIRWWSDTLIEWQEYRSDPRHERKTEVDAQFVAMLELRQPGLKLSERTLYRKWECYRDGDMDGLIDRRGQWRRGKSDMHPRIWEMFQDFYLDQRQFPVKKCVEYTTMWAAEYYPELVSGIPSVSTFRRRLEREMPKALKELGRHGEKAYNDRTAPFATRYYDDLRSNEYWVGDTHTFDIFTQNGDGRPHRMHLVAFIDARSGIFTGWCLTDNPKSDATLAALRHAILRCGVPENIYLDNGREFLNYDIGGLGHRQKKSTRGSFTAPPIFERLGIHMVNAIVRNARAKPIERSFRDLTNSISRVFSTYTGGNVLEKPENLKKRLKEGIPLDQELREAIDAMLDGYYNAGEYGGQVKADHGKSRIQVFNANLEVKRVASAEDLNLLLMRTTKPQTIGRSGVYITIYGEKIHYWSEDTHWKQGTRVHVRYDPADLAQVRIYDAETDRYMMTAPMHRDAIVRFGSTSAEDAKKVMHMERKVHRATKTLLDSKKRMSTEEGIDALSLSVKQAERARGTMQIGSGKVLELVRASEKLDTALPAAANDGGIIIDQRVLNRNAEQALNDD